MLVLAMSVCRLQAAAAELAAVNPELSQYLSRAAAGLREGLSPALALELAGPAALRRRNRFLTQAGLCLRRDGESLWAMAGRLAKRINSAHRRDLVGELLNSAAASASLPTSQRQLYSIILENLPD